MVHRHGLLALIAKVNPRQTMELRREWGKKNTRIRGFLFLVCSIRKLEVIVPIVKTRKKKWNKLKVNNSL